MIDNKKKMVLRYVPLGIDEDEAYILAECTDEEINILKNDTVFQNQLKVYRIMEEKRLLSLHKMAMKIAAEKGNTQGIQWKLSKMKPVKWGDGKKPENEATEPMRIQLVPYDKNSLQKEDDIDLPEMP